LLTETARRGEDEDWAPSVVLERQRLAVDGVPSDPGQARLIHGAPIVLVAVGVVLVLGRLGARRQSWPSADYDGRAMTTILITGGGRGLGRVTAEKLAAAGHRVLLTARTLAAAETATAAASVNGVKRRFMQVVLPHMPFATSVDAASDALAFMAVDPSIEAAAGQFFGEDRPIDSSPESHGASKARQFWELAAGFTGFDPLPHPGARA